jgi:diguanylate cyclase (GGDEF)-like protein/PAS domain S-box-containing protein
MQSSQEQQRAATKVMVVEDEVVIAMDTRHQLEDFGYNVVANAYSGEQALTEAQKYNPQIVIMDIVLGSGMDGITAAQTIVKKLHIPVIFLTAYSDPETLRRAKNSGATSYLIKPYRFAELHACIEVALHKHQMERKLRESQQWFAKTLYCISDAVIATDADGRIRFMNPVSEALTGVQFDKAKGKSVNQILILLDQKKREAVENPVSRALATQAVVSLGFPALLVSQPGQEFPVEASAAPIMDDDGTLLGGVMVFKDITQRCIVENLLRDSEERFSSAFDFAAIGMALVAVDGRYLQVNSSLARILGYAKEELLLLNFHDLSQDGECRNMLEHPLHQVPVEALTLLPIEVQCLHKTVGKMVWVLISGSLVCNEAREPQYFIIQVQDINERKAIEQQLTYIANHDALTGLLNRQQFHNRLTEALTYSRRHSTKLAVLFLDLDRFKLINDTLGHWIGDLLIKAVAERLKKSFRTNDTLARLGGDEFILLLSEIEQIEDVARIAQKTIDLLAQPFTLEGNDIIVNASVGISVFPDDGDNGQTLMMNADSAMYLAKERGKNNYQFYTLAMTERSIERMTIERGLRSALINREFKLYYQPQIELDTGRMVSCEALVRWHQPNGEVIGPDRFIVVAEETGLIVPIGAWVLQTACLQAKTWQETDGLFRRVAVNVSARQFLEHDLYQMVKNALAETGLNPSALELEITESAVMHDLEKTLQLLHQLHDLGVRLSIDDFGIGHSSLNYLRQFPVHSLKIDRSFVQNIPKDKGSMALVRAVIALAHELELDVTAEGVETKDQLAFLASHQCNRVQGYLICQPATISQLGERTDNAAIQEVLFGKND